MANSAEIESAGRERLQAVDLLRGVAIMGVIIAHVWSFTRFRGFRLPPTHSILLSDARDQVLDGDLLSALTTGSQVFFRSLWAVMPLFIMMSGTALTLAAERRGWHVNAPDFYVRRLRRLLPSYWAGWAVVVVALLLLAVPKTILDGGDFGTNATRTGHLVYYDRGQLIAGLTLLPRAFSPRWVFAPPNPLWFVVLFLQYYLLFPLLLSALRKFGVRAVLVVSFVVSVISTAGLVWYDGGRLGPSVWITLIWFPFRLFEFTLGMAIGYLMARSTENVRRALGGPFRNAFCIAAGASVYLTGATIQGEPGYVRAFAFPLMVTGVALMSLPVLFKSPGRLEASLPGRILVWIGPMSLPVLIMNEPFRFIDHYLWLKHLSWTPGWWAFIVVVYVPGTLLLGALLSRMLGLTPPGHPLQFLRGALPARLPSVRERLSPVHGAGE